MTHESTMLAATVILGLVYILTAGALSTSQRGFAWNAGNRDGQPPPLTGAAARAVRASANFLETFPLFAATVLAVMVAGKTSHLSATGADLFFWARVLYLPVYLAGIAYVRSLVWLVAMAGLIWELRALLG